MKDCVCCNGVWKHNFTQITENLFFHFFHPHLFYFLATEVNKMAIFKRWLAVFGQTGKFEHNFKPVKP